MAKVSQLQAAINKIDEEIALLQRARKVLTDTQAEKPKRERKARKEGAGVVQDGSTPERMRG